MAEAANSYKFSENPARSLLLVDDDEVLRNRLARAMQRKGFDVIAVGSVAAGKQAAQQAQPAFAICDLRLGDGSGLDVVEAIHQARPDARVVMLTGYGNIATAVAAVKKGAIDYLSKPADADAVAAALLNEKGELPPVPDTPMPADRVKWEHILRVFEQCDRNVSETARQLQMHRRTLQRILQKHAPKEALAFADEADEAQQ